MHRQKKKAEAQARSEEAQTTAEQDDDEARILFEQQRDGWVSGITSEDQYRIDTAADWTVAYMDAG